MSHSTEQSTPNADEITPVPVEPVTVLTTSPQADFVPNPKLGWIMLVVTMFIWGSFTLISRLGAGHSGLTAWDIGALRFGVSTLILLPIALYQGKLKRYFRPKPLGLAMTGGLVYSMLAYIAFAHAPAAHAAIWLNGLLPLFTALSAWLVLHERPGRDTWLSLVCILLGLAGMMLAMAWLGEFHLALGDLFFAAAAAFWGIYTALLKRWPMPPWEAMSAVAIGAAVVYLPFYFLFAPKGIAQASWGQIALQGVFQGVLVVIVAMLTYIAAIRHLGAFKAGSVLAMAPLFAAVAAVPLLNEPLTLPILIGITGMLLGAIQPWRWLLRQGR